MKRFFVVLGSLLMLPAFAEVAPIYYDEFVEYSDDVVDAIEDDADMTVQPQETQQRVASRTNSNRSTSRAISAATGTASRSDSGTRATAASIRDGQRVANRTTVSRTAKTATTSRANSAQRGTTTRPTVSARSSNTANRATIARVSANNAVMPAIKTTTDSSVKYLSTINKTLYNPNDASSRVGISSRRATVRSAGTSTPVVTESDISSTTTNLDAIAELTEYCKAQYAACMDNYCNVLDDNQGRCSCSKNLKNYQKVEEALAAATESFQDTVQKIKYIGLTGDQVTSLFAETEAELEMKSTSDSSQLKNSLDSIKKKIIDASSTNASSNVSGVSFDLSGLLDFDLSSGFDLGSFLNMNNSSSSNVSNQRGEQLYKTAMARCKTTVLNSCTAQGIEANIITNSYDLEIDKQCIAYERNLNDANDEMRNNVRNATTILQQARLMLAQNKNSYDLRGCVAAIDSCMQDEYVCGADYELCLDPTGKYLANGAIVKGGTPGVSGGTPRNNEPITNSNINDWTSNGMYELYSTWNYDSGNAWGGGKDENLGGYVDEKLTNWASGSNYTKTAASNDLATYLLQKIGYIDKDDKVHGMCASAMKQCQDYAFSNRSTSSKNYKPDNEVVRQYLLSALTKIKLQQDAIISDYAEDCRSDVSSCLSTNGYDETNTTTTASTTAVNACRADIVTCMSVSGYKPSNGTTLTLRNMQDWVASMLTVCPTDYYLYDTGDNAGVKCKPCGMAGSVPLISSGGQTTMCYCPDGYTATVTNSTTGHPTTCTPNN